MRARKFFGPFGQRKQVGSPTPRLIKGLRRRDAGRVENRRLEFESLEDRRMLAVYIVNNLDGADAVGSLRQCIDLSNASEEDDTIVFADALFTNPSTRVTTNATIALTGAELAITDSVQILGPSAATLCIVAPPNGRHFNINIGADDEFFPVTIGGLTLHSGNIVGGDDTDVGGSIFNRENLRLIEVAIAGNSASQGGGAIFHERGSLVVERSIIGPSVDPVGGAFLPGNSSGGGGGGILVGADGEDNRGTLTVINSTITGNNTVSVPDRPGWGGGVFNRNGTVNIQNSTIVGNNASVGGGGVATYGVGLEEDELEDVPPIITSLSHTILFNNTSGLGADDAFPVRTNAEGELIVPDIRFTAFNIVGAIGGAARWSSATGGNDNFYQVVSEPEGLFWTTANIADIAGGAGREDIHLATITSADENTFIFDELVDDPLYWLTFTPTEPMMMPPPPMNIGPWLGGLQIDTSMGPADGWDWVAPDQGNFVYTNWAMGEPDDGMNITEPPAMGSPAMNPPQDRLHFHDPMAPRRSGTWGDSENEPPDERMPIAFVVEYEQGSNYFGMNPRLLPLGYYGGSLPVFYPNSNPGNGPLSPAIDAGDPNVFSTDFDQRGRHFDRVFGAAIDVGAVEVQPGSYVVDTLFDESDGQYSGVWSIQNGQVVVGGYNNLGDLALREALEFVAANPESDIITFSPILTDPVLNLDLTPSAAPTILLKLKDNATTALLLNNEVQILGPVSFELEIDASGTDPTPNLNNADGTRLFLVDNGSAANRMGVTITNLTLMGGDVVDRGGAISNLEDLLLDGLIIKENHASNDGGGISTQIGVLTIEDTTMTANRAGDDGGALFVGTGGGGHVANAIVRNSTISGNVAGDKGAGVYNSDGRTLIEFSTITLNQSSSTRGAGVASMPGVNALTQVRSSIVSANVGADIEFLNGATNIQSLGFNIVGTGNAVLVFNQSGDLPNVTNPMLAPLSNTGGKTPTHRLLLGSPAIDAGDSTAVAGVGGVPLFDQRANPFTRVFDADLDTKARIDIGAYELQPTIMTVDTLSDVDDNNFGLNNFSLREAVRVANENPFNDTILFGINGTISTTGLTITDDLAIIGNGVALTRIVGGSSGRMFTIDDGSAATKINVSIRDMEMSNSIGAILSRENLALERMFFQNNVSTTPGPVIFHESGTLSLRLSEMTGNRTTGPAPGGAMYLQNAQVDMVYNGIAGNSTNQSNAHGGAIFVRNSTLTDLGSTITGNVTSGGGADGGGIYSEGSTLTLNESIVSLNRTGGANSEGGGIAGVNSNITVNRGVVAFNTTSGTQATGAGINMIGGALTLNRTLVQQNVTSGQNSPGGGIAMTGGTAAVNASSIFMNSVTAAGSNGGGISNNGGTLVVRDSTVSQNQATQPNSKGGGIYSDTNLLGTQSTLILNSTVSGNISRFRGGGVFNADGLLDIKHSTITNNDVQLTPPPGSVSIFNAGSGVGSQGSAATLTRIQSSIIAGNVGATATSPTGSDVDFVDGAFTNSIQSLGFNVIGNGNALASFSAGNGDKVNITNPMLGPLADNGGVMLLNGSRIQTHALLAGSPAINSGSPTFNSASFTPPLTTDQRGAGFARVLTGRIDVGSFELAFSPFTADFDLDGDVDGSDFMAWQRNNGRLSGATKAQGDANNDGRVNGADLALLKAQFGSVAVEAAIVGGDEQSPQAVMAPASAAASSSVAVPALAPVSSVVVTAIAPTLATPGMPGYVASAGVPGAQASRGAYRPPVERRAAGRDVVDAVHADYAGPSIGWSSASAGEVVTDFGGDASADESDEDAVFALLGEGLL